MNGGRKMPLTPGCSGRGKQGTPTPFAGFSLIELLVTVALILILTTMYWSPNTSSRQRQLKTACQRNLQNIYIAMEIYANEHGGRFPESTNARTSGQALDLLVPRYTSDTSMFTCPGSKDSTIAPGQSLLRHKISYAYYMGRSLTNTQQVLMSDKQINTEPKAVGQAAFSTTGKPPGNNHRRFGGNFMFGDGRLEMSPAKTPFPLETGPGTVLLNP